MESISPATTLRVEALGLAILRGRAWWLMATLNGGGTSNSGCYGLNGAGSLGATGYNLLENVNGAGSFGLATPSVARPGA